MDAQRLITTSPGACAATHRGEPCRPRCPGLTAGVRPFPAPFRPGAV